MDSIQAFQALREDGRVVGENVTAAEMIAMGWGPSRIVEIRWRYGGRDVVRKFEAGVHAEVVPGREYVAAIDLRGYAAGENCLTILKGDGSEHRVIRGVEDVLGRLGRGRFSWFEPPRNPSPNVLGVVFSGTGRSSDRHLDVAADVGVVVGIYDVR